MAESSPGPAGSIYDLGYRPYEGVRLGRQYAIVSLFAYSLRSCFGIGRSLMAKAFPIGLAVIALIPALVQLAVAAAAPADFELVPPEDYFELVQIIVALFCAVVAPELVGRDQINHTLPLYFSRALSRADYVTAKAGALVAALFIVIATPQVLLLIGNAVATDDLVEYAGDNIDLILPILATSLVASVMLSAISLAIASRAPRRAFGTGAVIAFFAIFSVLAAILVDTTTGDTQSYMIFLGPLDVLTGFGQWLFGAEATSQPLRDIDLPGSAFLGGVAAYTGLALALLYRYFQRLPV